MFAELTQRGKSSAFQAGFWRRFMPQNKFYGYENSAFQAKKHPWIQKSIAVKTFNSPANLCLKGNNLHNCRLWPADKNVPVIPAWKAELLQLHKWISAPTKRNKQNCNFQFSLPTSLFLFLIIHSRLIHKPSVWNGFCPVGTAFW